MPDRMYDAELRAVLCDHLAFGCGVIKREVTIGRTRADVVWIAPDGMLWGFEIKGDTDPVNSQRFKMQIEEYSKVFDYCTLMVSGNGNKITAARKVVPPWWGLAVVSPFSKIIMSAQDGTVNTNVDLVELASQIWKRDLMQMLTQNGIAVRAPKSRKEVIARQVTENFTHDQIRSRVVEIWAERKVDIDKRFKLK